MNIYSLTLVLSTVLLFNQPALAKKEPLVPQTMINDFLKDYSAEEKDLINQDFKAIRAMIFYKIKPIKGSKVYVATAGGPGSSKSTILESYLQDHPMFAYVDPDQRALKFMNYTYRQGLSVFAISKAKSFKDLLQEQYNKWRGGSNFIAQSILNEAVEKQYSIAHGTTSTSKTIDELYKKLKARGYKIVLLLCGSTDENRIKSINNRDTYQGFAQSSADDVGTKGKAFWETLPTYFKYADEIQIYWVDDFDKGFKMVATYSPKDGFKTTDPDIKKFENQYELIRGSSDKNLPAFNQLALKTGEAK